MSDLDTITRGQTSATAPERASATAPERASATALEEASATPVNGRPHPDLVSVVMASLLEGDWRPSLDALLGQTYEPVEIVLVVDREAGEAERAALARAYPTVRWLFNEGNIGLTPSLNRGMRAARGRVLFRCDDDDVSVPHRLERQLALLDEQGLDLVCSHAEGFVAGTDRRWAIVCPADDAGLKRALERRNVIVHATLGVRREAMERLGYYREDFRNAQDYDLHLRAIRAGMRFGAVPEPLVARAYGDGTITVRRRKKQIMYSMSAALLHAANREDERHFLRVVFRYLRLLLVPDRARRFRRVLSGLTGRGA